MLIAAAVSCRTGAAEACACAVDADLGGGVIKQRIARESGGRSGGFRTLVPGRQEIWRYSFTDLPVGLMQKQRTAIRCHAATVEPGHNPAPSEAFKLQLSCCTVCVCVAMGVGSSVYVNG